MMQSTIIPFQGLGNLRFGLSRAEVHALLGEKEGGFIKGGGNQNETEVYDSLGLHLYYDENDKLEFIESFPPCSPTYQEIQLLNDGLEEVLEHLSQLGHTTRYEDEGYYFDELGFVLYVPHTTIEAVSVYPRGYYDDLGTT